MSAQVGGVRAVLRRIAEEGVSPVRLGVAAGVGVLISCTPFFGFHLWLALLIAWPLRLNKVAVALGTQFSIPPLIPLIVFASVNLGELILHQRTLSLTREHFRTTAPWALFTQVGVSWLVGGLVFGLIAGSIVGGVVTILASRARDRRVGYATNRDDGSPHT